MATHQVATAHGTLQFEPTRSNGKPVVLVTLAKPFFPAFSFCLSLTEHSNLIAAATSAMEEFSGLPESAP